MPSSLRSRLSASGSLKSVYARSLQPYEGRFEAQALMREAEQATGLSDWGGDRRAEAGFRARFNALCQGIETEARITPAGRSAGHSRLHMMLCSRLRIVAWCSERADQAPIVEPLIGTGVPRAGTSFLHQLLAQDPDNLSATAAQAAIPIPPPAAITDEAERVQLMESLFTFQGLDAPEVNAVHPFVADQPEECVNMQEAACASLYQAFFNVPNYMTVVRETVADLYAWQKGVMQVLQSGQSAKRWVLKTPEHMSHWSTLIDTFPDAKIFMNHRDPARVIPSIASLFATFQRLYSKGAVDPKYLGPPMLAGQMDALEKVGAWRAAHPEVTVVDVRYLDLVADPIATAERVYAAFGLTLSAKTKQRMTAFIKVNRHGQAAQGVTHRYKLADFGLTEAMIEDAAASYIEKYGITREKRT